MTALPENRDSWDWWPLARLLTTGAVLGLAAHYHLGWTPDIHHLARLPREAFEVLTFFTLVSFALAHIYLILLMLPLYAVVTLNDTFYDATCWVASTVLRVRSPLALALSGLCGGIASFSVLLMLSRSFLSRL